MDRRTIAAAGLLVLALGGCGQSSAPTTAQAPAAPTWAQTWPTLGFPTRPDKIPASVDFRYDEFNDYTAVQMYRIPVAAISCDLDISTTAAGKLMRLSQPPEQVLVSLHRFDGSPPAELVFLVDGVRIRPTPDRSMADAHWRYFTINTADVLTIVNGKSVRGRGDADEFTLSDADKKAIGEFAASLLP